MNTSPRFRYCMRALVALTAAWSSVRAQDGVGLGASFYRYREDAAKAVVTVFRGSDTSGAITVEYATEDITAVAGHDYTATSGSLTLAEGEARKRIEIPLAPDDPDVEPNQTFRIALSNIRGGPVAAPLTAIVQIDDDDTALICPDTSATRSAFDRSAGRAVVRVVRERGLDREVSVQFQTASESWGAQPGRDFEPRTGRLVFAPGQTEQIIEIPLIQNDAAQAGNTFVVRFEDPQGEAFLLAREATVFIAAQGPPAPLRELDLSFGTINALVPSPDGTLLLTAGSKGAFVWETGTATLLQRFPDRGPRVPGAMDEMNMSVAVWSPDMSQIAASTGGAIYLWNRASGALVKTMVLQDDWSPGDGPPSLSFSSDGRLLAHGSPGSVDLWNLEWAGSILVRPDRVLGVGTIAHSGALALSPDGRHAVVAGSRGAGVWNLESGTLLRFFDVGSRYGSPALSGDGQSAALSGASSVRLFDLGSGRLVLQLPRLESPSLSHDGRRLAGVYAVSRPCEVRVYDTSTGALRFRLPLLDAWWPVITPDGTRVLFRGTTTDSVHLQHWMLYNVAAGTRLWSRPGVFGPPAIAPDGTRAVLVRNGDTSSTLHAIDLSNGDTLFEASFPGSVGKPLIGGFTSDGSRFLLRTSDLLCVFNVDEHRLERTWNSLLDTWLSTLGWNADGSQIIEMGTDRVQHRDVATGALVREVALASVFSQARQITFSSSDDELLVVDRPSSDLGSPRAMVVDVLTGEVLSQVVADQCWVGSDRVLSSELSPDTGSILTVRDARTSQILHMSDHPGLLRGAALSADGRLLAVSHYREQNDAGSGTTSLLLDLRTGTELWRREEEGYNANAVVGMLPNGSGILLARGPFERSRYYLPALWDWASDEARTYYFGHGGRAARMSPDGSHVLAVHWAQVALEDMDYVSHVALWDVHRGELAFGTAETEPKVSQDWKRMVTVDAATGVGKGWTLWDLDTGQPIRRFNVSNPESCQLQQVSLSSDGHWVAGSLRPYYGSQGTCAPRALVWAADTGQEEGSIAHDGDIGGFAPDGRLILHVGEHSSTWGYVLWHPGTGGQTPFLTSPLAPTDFFFSPDGSRVLAFTPMSWWNATTWNDSIDLWNPATGTKLASIGRRTAPNMRAVFSPDGLWVAFAINECANGGSPLLLLDADSGATKWSTMSKLCESEIVFSPDSQWLLLGGDYGLEVRESSSGRVVTELTSGRYPLGKILGFESSTRFWTQSSSQSSVGDDVLRLWDLSAFLGPRLGYEHAGDRIQLRWDRGVLQWTDSLNSLWTDLPAASPFPLSPIGNQGFFRVKVED